MITLYGVALSPYYNKVKVALIEKGVNFREQPAAPAPGCHRLPMAVPSRALALLPSVSQACRRTLDRDLVPALPELVAYLKALAQRSSVTRTWPERDVAVAAFQDAHQAG